MTTNLEIYLPDKPEKIFVRKDENDKQGVFYIRQDVIEKIIMGEGELKQTKET